MSREKVKLDKVLELNTALVGIKAKLADKSNLDFELLTLKFKQLDGLVREFSDEELIENKIQIESSLNEMIELVNLLESNKETVKIELGEFMRNNNKLRAYKTPK